MWLLPLLLLAAPSPAITVLYFDNNSGDNAYDALGKGLADMMITDLAKVPDLVIVERDRLEALLRELKLQRTKLFDPKTAQRLGKGIGAKYAVAGAFLAFDPEMRVDVRVIEIASAKVVNASQVTGKKDAFFALEAELARALAIGLAEVLKRPDLKIALQSGATKLASVNDYGEGLDYRDDGDLTRASEEMQAVLAMEPAFPLAKKRSDEIGKELEAARAARRGALAEVEAELLEVLDAHADALLSGRVESPGIRQGHEAKTLVRGELYLKRVADALERREKYRTNLFLYVDNTQRLIEFMDERDSRGQYGTRWLGYQCETEESCLMEEEREQMAQLGLTSPLSDKQRGMLHQLSMDLANLMMHGEAPARIGWKMPKRVCFYPLDKRFPARAFELYDFAEKTLTQYPADMWEWWQKEIPQQGVVVSLWRAKSYDRLGKTEEALAALQSGMKKYPKAKNFRLLDDAAKQLLAKKRIAEKCEDPR